MLKHKGLSGFGIKHSKDIVTKWTQGNRSASILLESFRKQITELKNNSLKPLKTVDIYGFQQREDYFEFTMPLLDLESGFTTDKTSMVKQLIIQSIRNRSSKEVMGFQGIIKHRLKELPDSKQKESLLSSAESVIESFYPYGYAHGDMGFANMLVGDRDIFMIGFTESFINSPLLDIATLWLSSKSEVAKDWHRELVGELFREYARYTAHIHLIRRVLILGYMKDYQSDKTKKDLLDLFYA